MAGSIGPGVAAYDEEVFGPVLCCVAVETLQEAILLVNSCEYGNGAHRSRSCKTYSTDLAPRYVGAVSCIHD